MTWHRDIRQGLRKTLITVPGLPADRAWENVSFDPAGVSAYVEEHYMPATQAVRTLPQPGGVVDEYAVYQISLRYPLNQGTDAADVMTGAIMATFRPGTSIIENGSTTKVRRVEAAQGRRDGAFWHVPVSVYLRGQRTP